MTQDRLVRAPNWRTRTTPRRRHIAASFTLAVVISVGVALMVTAATILDRFGAPTPVRLATWLAPTVAVAATTLLRPTAATASADDDESWVGYTIRWALIGDHQPRSVAHRLVAAGLVGGPIGWSLILLAALTAFGII